MPLLSVLRTAWMISIICYLGGVAGWLVMFVILIEFLLSWVVIPCVHKKKSQLPPPENLVVSLAPGVACLALCLVGLPRGF